MKALKITAPDQYRATLARIEAARLGWGRVQIADAATPEPAFSPRPRTRSLESLAEAFRKAAAVDSPEEGLSATLTAYRRGLIYAATQLRSDMLSGLPLRLYRWVDEDGEAEGRGAHRPRVRVARVPGSGGGRRSLVEADEKAGPLAKLLSLPNDDTSFPALLKQVETSLCIVGQAHVRIHRAGNRPVGLSFIKHTRLELVRAGADDAERTVKGWKLDGARGEFVPAADIVWLRYPDPEDPDYGVLAPAQVAALGSEAYRQAMRSNLDIFRKGLRARAILTPPEDMAAMGWDQMEELQQDVDRLLRGADNNHNVTAMPFRFGVTRLDITPADAEFVGLLEFSIEDVARAFKVPIEMIGGTRRTYQNTEAADRAFWGRCLEPEAAWIAGELSRRLLPAAGLGDGYELCFDLSGVTALQDDESLYWQRDRELAGVVSGLAGQVASGMLGSDQAQAIMVGVLDLDPALAASVVGQGGPVAGDGAGGDTLPAPDAGAAPDALAAAGLSAAPTTSLNGAQIAGLIQLIQLIGNGPGQLPKDAVVQIIVTSFALPRDRVDEMLASIPASGIPQPVAPDAGDGRAAIARAIEAAALTRGTVEWDSAEHRGILERAERKQTPHVRAFAEATAAVMRRQEASLLARLGDGGRGRGQRKAPTVEELRELFNVSRWTVETRTAVRDAYRAAAKAAGKQALDSVKAGITFTGNSKPVVNALQRRAQRFAQSITDTTWEALKRSLSEGIEEGEGEPELADRVRSVMGDRIRSSGETIARTEVHGTFEQTGVLAIQQASAELGLSYNKEWVSSLDERVRPDHADAHGQTVAIDVEFEVGGARGQAPGDLGEPEQDINCRCTSRYVVSDSGAIQGPSDDAGGGAESEPVTVDRDGFLDWLASVDLPKPSDAEREATENYTEFVYRKLNAQLRGVDISDAEGGDYTDEVMQKTRRGLDKLIARGATLDRDLVVYRGGGRVSDGEFTDPAFVSSTTDEGVALWSFSLGGKKPFVEIRIPAGTKFIAPDGVLGNNESVEAEIILGRNTRFRFVRRETRTGKYADGREFDYQVDILGVVR